MKVYEVHLVHNDGSSKWLATFVWKIYAEDFIKMYRMMYTNNVMFSITEVNK